MKRHLLILITIAMLTAAPTQFATAGEGGHQGHSRTHDRGSHHGISHGFDQRFDRGFGLGFGGGYYDCDLAELYRELYHNLPHFALHPPVYYSYPVPRTFGYSPFAYGPNVMTPELAGPEQSTMIINPYVPTSRQQPETTPDRTAAASPASGPLVIINPFVDTASIAQAGP